MSKAQPSNVKPYWEKVADDFDAIYSGEKGALSRALDKFFRKDMYDRYRMTLEVCGDESIRSVLDVGTGSGRFSLPLAEKKDRVFGLDFSAPMIEIARKYAEERGVTDRCTFDVGDFLEYELNEPFDAVIGIGLFDYIREPGVFLEKMARLANKTVVATYPRVWTWRAPVRWVRLNLLGCPVYFFTASRIRKMYADAGLEIERLKKVGKIHFVVARPVGG